MPSKKIEVTCPDCLISFLRYSHSVSKAIKNSGLWRCQGCTLKSRNTSKARPLLSKRKKGKCVQIKTSEGWMLEHRYIMEQHLGRKLNVSEAVHHINHSRSDNRLENLEVMGHGEHTKMHHTGLKRSDETRKRISELKTKGDEICQA